jgi:hypothetical protein
MSDSDEDLGGSPEPAKALLITRRRSQVREASRRFRSRRKVGQDELTQRITQLELELSEYKGRVVELEAALDISRAAAALLLPSARSPDAPPAALAPLELARPADSPPTSTFSRHLFLPALGLAAIARSPPAVDTLQPSPWDGISMARGSARVGFSASPIDALIAESRELMVSAARDVGKFIGDSGWETAWRDKGARGSFRSSDAPIVSTLVEVAASRVRAASLAAAAWSALTLPTTVRAELGPSVFAGRYISSLSLTPGSAQDDGISLWDRRESWDDGGGCSLLLAASRIGPISRKAAADFLGIEPGARALTTPDGSAPSLTDDVYLGVARTCDPSIAKVHGLNRACRASAYAGYVCVDGACRLFASTDVVGRLVDSGSLVAATRNFGESIVAAATPRSSAPT